MPIPLAFASFPHFLRDTRRVGRVGVTAPPLRSSTASAGAASSGPGHPCAAKSRGRAGPAVREAFQFPGAGRYGARVGI